MQDRWITRGSIREHIVTLLSASYIRHTCTQPSLISHESSPLPRQLPLDPQRQLAPTRLDHILKRALEHDIRHLVIIDIARIVRHLLARLDGVHARALASSGTPRRGSVGHQLRLDAAVEGAEEEGRAVDRLGRREVPVVLEDAGFGRAQGGGDVLALHVLLERDAAKGREAVVFVEPTVVGSAYSATLLGRHSLGRGEGEGGGFGRG